MKILALSLLRLGDFFQQVHVLRGLQLENSESKISVLVFDDLKSAHLEGIFPEFDFIYIPRLELQGDLVEFYRPWYRAALIFDQILRDCAGRGWDRVVNLTQTRFSVGVTKILRKLCEPSVEFVDLRVSDLWLQDRFPSHTWIEEISRGLPSLNLPAVEAPIPRSGGALWIQPLTSDERKNWPLRFWKEFVDEWHASDQDVFILGAPSDRERLASVFPVNQLRFWNFEEMKNQFHLCGLLISGDTSVLHFAALYRVPCLGVYLGPANPRKTPPRYKDPQILQPTLSCFPCEHRGNCVHSEPICAFEITKSAIAERVRWILKKKIEQEGDIHV